MKKYFDIYFKFLQLIGFVLFFYTENAFSEEDGVYGYLLTETDSNYTSLEIGDQIPRRCIYEKYGGNGEYKSKPCTDYNKEALKEKCKAWRSAGSKGKDRPKYKNACVFKDNKWQIGTYTCDKIDESEDDAELWFKDSTSCNTLSVDTIGAGEVTMGPSVLNSSESKYYTIKAKLKAKETDPNSFYRSQIPKRLDSGSTSCTNGDAVCEIKNGTDSFKIINLDAAEITYCYTKVKKGQPAGSVSCNQRHPNKERFCEPYFFDYPSKDKDKDKKNIIHPYQGWWWVVYLKSDKRKRTVCKGGVGYLAFEDAESGTSYGTAVTSKWQQSTFDFDLSGLTPKNEFSTQSGETVEQGKATHGYTDGALEMVSACYIGKKRYACDDEISYDHENANFCYKVTKNSATYDYTKFVKSPSTATCTKTTTDSEDLTTDDTDENVTEITGGEEISKKRGNDNFVIFDHNVKKGQCFRRILKAKQKTKKKKKYYLIKEAYASPKWFYRSPKDGKTKKCDAIETFHLEGKDVESGKTSTGGSDDGTSSGGSKKSYIGLNSDENIYIGSSSSDPVVTISEPDPDSGVDAITINGTLTAEKALTASETLTAKGDITAESKLTVTGETAINGALKANAGLKVTGDATITGSITTSSITTSSDERLKRNIQLIENPLEKILNLRGVTFNFMTEQYPDYRFPSNKQVGIIAQDLEKVLPEAVKQDSNGFLQVQYDRIVALVIEAIKKLNQNIENIQNQQLQDQMQNKNKQDVMEAELISLKKKVQEQSVIIENQCKKN